MKDLTKKLTVVNTDKRYEETGKQDTSVGGSGYKVVSMYGNWLDKDIWDSSFEVRTTEDGENYLFGKLPVVMQYGLTMYSGLDNIKVMSIAEGLPYDNKTIKYNKETKTIEVIGGMGGSTDLSGYAKETWVTTYFARKTDLNSYVPIAGETKITGKKTFVAGLNGRGNQWEIGVDDLDNPFIYLTSSKNWIVTTDAKTKQMKIGEYNAPMILNKNGDVEICGSGIIDGNLLVKGGISFYSASGTVSPFLIDVEKIDDIKSESTTQVYTANTVKLLKEALANTTKELDVVKTKLENAGNALVDIESKTTIKDITTALAALRDSL